uniref:Uncharacterized protein n=1 Tax=Arundo donax TaxID=35708 RepID=A0A0A9CFE2_ARUDO
MKSRTRWHGKGCIRSFKLSGGTQLCTQNLFAVGYQQVHILVYTGRRCHFKKQQMVLYS